EYVKNVMKPANIVAVVPQEDNNSLLIVVDDKDLSVAIGKKGINARLASKLLDKKIEIKSVSAVEKEGIDYQNLMMEFQEKEEAKLQEDKLRQEKEEEAKQQEEIAKLQEELRKQQEAAEEVYEPEFNKDASGRSYDSYDEVDFVENNSKNVDKDEDAITLQAKEQAEEKQQIQQQTLEETNSEESKEPTKRRKAKLTVKASDYVSKYEELADAKKVEKVQTTRRKKNNSKEDQEEKEIKEKIEALKKQDYEIKPEYTEEELAEFENPEEEHWYDDDNVDYDEYDEFYDK
ncbi:MAG: hypothetical protein Q4C64_08055, partial [Erysipelotrichia bacterium]|nr:hypothetical protein [Erysipelotrichia bacterium]